MLNRFIMKIHCARNKFALVVKGENRGSPSLQSPIAQRNGSTSSLFSYSRAAVLPPCMFVIKSVIIIASLTCVFDISHANSAKANPVISMASNHLTFPNDWTGFYGGVNIGGIFNDAHLNANHIGFTSLTGVCNTQSSFSSFFPGGQLGYSYQLNRKVVLGVEGDFTYNINGKGRTHCTCEFNPGVSDQFTILNQMQGSLRGRIGYALDKHLLPFFTAGASLADLGTSYSNEIGNFYSEKSASGGWLVGAGLEWAFSERWSLRAEYYYVDYGNALNMKIPDVYGLLDTNGSVNSTLNANNVRIAINYWI